MKFIHLYTHVVETESDRFLSEKFEILFISQIKEKLKLRLFSALQFDNLKILPALPHVITTPPMIRSISIK